MSVNIFGTSKESTICWDHALKTEFCYLLSVVFKNANNIPSSNPTRENNFQISNHCSVKQHLFLKITLLALLAELL